MFQEVTQGAAGQQQRQRPNVTGIPAQSSISRPPSQTPAPGQAAAKAYRGMSGMNRSFHGRSIGFEQELLRFYLLKAKDNKSKLVGRVECQLDGRPTVVLWITTDSVKTADLTEDKLEKYAPFYIEKTNDGKKSYSIETHTIEFISNPFDLNDQKAEDRLKEASRFAYCEINTAAADENHPPLKEITRKAGTTNYTLKIDMPEHRIFFTVGHCVDTADQITIGVKTEDILTDKGSDILKSIPWCKIPKETDVSDRKIIAYYILKGFLDKLYQLERAQIYSKLFIRGITQNVQPNLQSKLQLEPADFNNAAVKNGFGVLPRSSLFKILDTFDETTQKEIRKSVFLDFLKGKDETEKKIAMICFQYLQNRGSVSYHPNLDEAKIDGQDSLLFEYRLQDRFPADFSKKLPAYK